jgi:hypothetical protein
MKKEIYYAKSFEEDYATKSLEGKKKVTCQTVYEIVKRKILKPNTKSFGRQKRLSCTILAKNYTKTYRPQGIIFQTKTRPDYVLPFDLVLLGATDNIIVQYYRIKNNLHVYYNYGLIKGFDKFIFKDFSKMMRVIRSPSVAWKKVNEFRRDNGYKYLPRSKHRLVEYNEVVFNKSIRIRPVALFGYRKETRRIAKRLGLPCFASAKQFYEKLTRIKR